MDFDKDFRQVVTIIEQLRATNSTNDKIVILKANSDNELLKMVLFYTYNKFLKYKITEKTYNSTVPSENYPTSGVFEMLNHLSKTNISDKTRSYVVGYIENEIPEYARDTVKKMLFKDLRIKMNATTINKAIPNLIPVWQIALASPSKDAKKWKNSEWISIQMKLNGERGCCYLGTMYSRSGHEQENLDHITNDLDIIAKNFGLSGAGDLYFDGELINKNRDFAIPDEENFRITRSILSSDSADKTNIEFVLFDVITKDEFDRKTSKNKYSERLKQLEAIQSKIDELQLEHVRVIPLLYKGNYDKEVVKNCLNYMDSLELEGTIIHRDTVYRAKKSTDMIKCKSFFFNDVKIIGFKEGNGEFKGTLGSLIVDYKGYPCGVGGFNSKLRDEIWNNKDKYLGRVCTVKCKGETNNKDNDDVSMQFPVWNKLCDIDKKVSYES